VIFLFATYFVAALIAALRDAAVARARGPAASGDAAALAEGAYPAVFADEPSPLPCGCCRRADAAKPAEAGARAGGDKAADGGAAAAP